MNKWEFYKDDALQWRWKCLLPDGEIKETAPRGYPTYLECLNNARLSGYRDRRQQKVR